MSDLGGDVRYSAWPPMQDEAEDGALVAWCYGSIVPWRAGLYLSGLDGGLQLVYRGLSTLGSGFWVLGSRLWILGC